MEGDGMRRSAGEGWGGEESSCDNLRPCIFVLSSKQLDKYLKRWVLCIIQKKYMILIQHKTLKFTHYNVNCILWSFCFNLVNWIHIWNLRMTSFTTRKSVNSNGRKSLQYGLNSLLNAVSNDITNETGSLLYRPLLSHLSLLNASVRCYLATKFEVVSSFGIWTSRC